MKNETRKVTLKVNDKEFVREYQATIYESAEDLLALLSKSDAETQKQIAADYTYGSDLKVKAKIRQQLESEAAGPDKAIAKLVTDLVKQYASVGKTITEEQARAVLAPVIAGLSS